LHDAKLLVASMRPPETRWEKRAQMISFAAYNVLLDKPEGTDPWPYVIGAAKAHDERSGLWVDGSMGANVSPNIAWCTWRLITKRNILKRLNAKS
jgi:hypothetical protein